MPELPEVQTIVTTLRPRLVGQRITSLELARRDIVSPSDVDLSACLLGRTITAIDRRGKRIVFTLEDTSRFYIHLGMSGRLTVESPDASMMPHTHLVVTVGSGQWAVGSKNATAHRPPPAADYHLRFRDPRRFGGVWWLGKDGSCDDRMGPEPLELKAGELARRLGGTTRAIKNALLDQRLIAGLGNIYVDESLFAAGTHPLTPADQLSRDQVVQLGRAIKTVLRRAIRHRGSTLRDYVDAEGQAGGFQKVHRVYGREGQPCVACQSPIQRIVLGGRSTHFCPKCQPPASRRPRRFEKRIPHHEVTKTRR